MCDGKKKKLTSKDDWDLCKNVRFSGNHGLVCQSLEALEGVGGIDFTALGCGVDLLAEGNTEWAHHAGLGCHMGDHGCGDIGL